MYIVIRYYNSKVVACVRIGNKHGACEVFIHPTTATASPFPHGSSTPYTSFKKSFSNVRKKNSSD